LALGDVLQFVRSLSRTRPWTKRRGFLHNGICDLVENCTGSTAACPTDAKSTAPCRPSAGICDTAESCNGVAVTCPADALATVGTTCRSATGLCDVAGAVKLLWAAYPPAVTFVVVATANHWWFDAFTGALVAAVSAVAAVGFARWRPSAWAWAPPAPAPATR